MFGKKIFLLFCLIVIAAFLFYGVAFASNTTTQEVIVTRPSVGSGGSGGSGGGGTSSTPAATPSTTTTTGTSTDSSSKSTTETKQTEISKESAKSSETSTSEKSSSEGETAQQINNEKEMQVEVIKQERAAQIEQIKQEAEVVLKGVETLVETLGVERNKQAEAAAIKLAEKIIIVEAVSSQTKEVVQNFVAYGTPETTPLGAGERAGVVRSYQESFNKLPATKSEWEDVIKISKGRWPSGRSEKAETSAKEKFQTIYKREPKMTLPNDNAAVTIIAYGLRPAQRNLNSERAGITIYKKIFRSTPKTAREWDTVRAISYSGATR